MYVALCGVCTLVNLSHVRLVFQCVRVRYRPSHQLGLVMKCTSLGVVSYMYYNKGGLLLFLKDSAKTSIFLFTLYFIIPARNVV